MKKNVDVDSKRRELVQKIENCNGAPVAIEALWDGDSGGWFIRLNVVLKEKRFFLLFYDTKQLLIISVGSDIRILNGTVPPWSESEITKEIGSKVSEKFIAQFFFPSPDNPDDDCPDWINRKRAITCSNCQKLILPRMYPDSIKDLCYLCELEIE